MRKLEIIKLAIFTAVLGLGVFADDKKVLAEEYHAPNVPLPSAGTSSYYIPFSFPVIGAVSANLDGDAVLDWVVKSSPWQTGTTKLEAKTLDGRLLWTFDTGQSNKETWAPNSFEVGAAHTAWDLDGDGIDEVFTTYWDGSKGNIAALNGATGQVKSMIPLPYGWGNIGADTVFPPMMGAHLMAIGYLDGPNARPSLLVEHGTYTGGALWVFDWDPVAKSLKHRWTYQNSHSGLGTTNHYISTFDLNSDGLEEIIMGGTLINPDGTKLFSLVDRGQGHVDFSQPGDHIPDNDHPGYEMFWGSEQPFCNDCNAAIMTNWDGSKIYWEKKGTHFDAGYVANITDQYPGNEIVMQNKDLSLKTVWTSLGFDTGMQYHWKRVPEWTGDGVYDVSVGGPGPGYNSFVCDVGGGEYHGAEEIISLDGNASGGGWIEIKFNKTTAKSYPSRWANRHYRQDCATSSSGHSNHGVYMVQELKSPICVNFTYSGWSACQPNGKRTRTIVSRLPEGCIPGEQTLSEPCEYQFACNEINPYGAYIEAEHFTGTIAWTTGTTGFTLGNTQPSFFGEGYLKAGNSNEGKEYEAYFPEAGEYSFWVRGFGFNGNSDSIYFGLDGKNIGALFHPNNNYTQWAWVNTGSAEYSTGKNSVTVLEAGIHKVNIWKREEGYLVDGIYLAKKGNVPADILHGTTIDPRSCTGADVNSDTRVNIKDIQICIKAIVDPGSFTTPDQLNQLAKCEAVALPDTTVNIKDIQEIIRKIITPVV